MHATIFFINFLLVHSEIAKRFDLYSETRWDSLVYDPDVESNDRSDIIRSLSGFLDKHDPDDLPENFIGFGDLNLITLNLYREVIVESETMQSAENIKTILDEGHPTFLALQGVDDTLLELIKKNIFKHSHYYIINYDKFDYDKITGQKVFLPIIYDTSLVIVKNSGYFETDNDKKKTIYGSFIEVTDLRMDLNKVGYTVINVDMFSSFNDVVSAEFSNIVSDITSYNEVKNHPVFIMGGIGTVPPNVKNLMKSAYVNLIEQDDHNKTLPRTTVHAGRQDDGIQRDFILMRDPKMEFKLNYARILREFLAGDHYPVHAILELVKNREASGKPVEVIHNKQA